MGLLMLDNKLQKTTYLTINKLYYQDNLRFKYMIQKVNL